MASPGVLARLGAGSAPAVYITVNMVFIIVGHLISRHFTIVRRTTEQFPPMPPHMFFLPLWYALLHLNIHSCFLAYAMSEREDGEILQEVLENGTRLKRTRDCWQVMAGSTKGNGGPGLWAREMTILRRDAIQKKTGRTRCAKRLSTTVPSYNALIDAGAYKLTLAETFGILDPPTPRKKDQLTPTTHCKYLSLVIGLTT